MAIISVESVRRILCLGAHSDDIEIGLGGTLLNAGSNRFLIWRSGGWSSAPRDRVRKKHGKVQKTFWRA